MDCTPISHHPLINLKTSLEFVDAGRATSPPKRGGGRDVRGTIALHGSDDDPAVYALLAAGLADAAAMVTAARSRAFTCQRTVYEHMAAMLRAARYPW